MAAIVPAYREARIIGRMLQRVPATVDAVYVVDDGSDDDTLARAAAIGDPRVRCLRHPENQGVGAAIATGYRAALQGGQEILVVMAGDDQMHPDDLPGLLGPIARGEADYVKGNRFLHADAALMPVLRRWGSQSLSLLTRLTSGLAVGDCQCGYTALSSRAARLLELGELWPRFGYPNDLLLMLSSRGVRVRDVPVRPVYADEQSGLRAWHVATIAGVIARRAWIEQRRARTQRGERALTSP